MEAPAVRERQFNMRLSADEMRRLDLLAEHYGLTASSVVRMLIKRDAAKAGIEVAKKPKKKGGSR